MGGVFSIWMVLEVKSSAGDLEVTQPQRWTGKNPETSPLWARELTPVLCQWGAGSPKRQKIILSLWPCWSEDARFTPPTSFPRLTSHLVSR